MAVEKKWKGGAKIAIFVADAPCHGGKYHDLRGENDDDYLDEGEEIEKYVKFFAENEISLFCAKLSPTTEKMFSIFADVYNRNKEKDSRCTFVVGKINNLSQAVIENAAKIYNDRKEGEEDEKAK